MNLFDLVFASRLSAGLGIGSFAVSLGAVLATVMIALRRSATLRELMRLAEDGNAQEARVAARSAGAPFKPLLAALGGAAAGQPPLGLRVELMLALLALAPLLALPAAALRILRGTPGPELAPSIVGLMAAGAITAPWCLLAAALVLRIGRASSRTIRSACVEILALPIARAEKEETTAS